MDARHAQSEEPLPYHKRSKMDVWHAQNGAHNGPGYRNSAFHYAAFDAFRLDGLPHDDLGYNDLAFPNQFESLRH